MACYSFARRSAPGALPARVMAWLLGILIALACAAFAQEPAQNDGQSGIVMSPDVDPPVSPTARFRLDLPEAVTLAPLTLEERTPHVRGRLRSVGTSRALPPRAIQSGAWNNVGGVHRLWRVLLKTAEARIVRVHFDNFHVGGGAVFVTNPDDLTETFRFDGDGPHRDGEFWSPLIHSDSALVEYELDDPTGEATKLPFDLNAVTHILAAGQVGAGPGDYACYVDYACGTASGGGAVAQLSYINSADGLSYVCTGTLLNTKADNGSTIRAKPLLLTANHCISDNITARSVAATFNDWYLTCASTTLARSFQVLGQSLLAHTSYDAGDHSLLLMDVVPSGASLYLSGWSSYEFAMGGSAIGLHHPAGLPLKVSRGTRIADEDVNVTESGKVDGFASAVNYYHVGWDSGDTGGGSSGSGLYDGSGRLFGTLTWGNGKVDGNQCGTEAGYGRLYIGFSALQPWLEGPAGGQTISQLVSPPPSSALSGSSAVFSWSTSTDAIEYQLTVGTAPGASNIFNRNMKTLTQVTVTGLPTNGSTLYVRLFTHVLIGWFYFDYNYTAQSNPSSATPSITSLTPASVPAMSPDTNLIISGTNFVSGASATWTFNGVSTGLNTQFVSATTLNALIPATLLTIPGVAAITVANPTGSPSKIATFAISTPVGPVYTSSTSIPHFGAGGSFVSILYVLNNSNSNAQFQITFLDDAGRQTFVPVAGVGTVAQFGDSVPANGLKYYELGNGARSLSSGSVLINSTAGLTVQEVFRNHAPDNTYYEAGIQSTAGSRGFEVPFDATIFPGTNAQIFTGIAIANLDPTNVATVSCTARDSNGFIIPNAVSVPQLGPLGHWANYVFPALNGRRGMLDCSSNTTIAPVGLRFLGANAFSTLPIILK